MRKLFLWQYQLAIRAPRIRLKGRIERQLVATLLSAASGLMRIVSRLLPNRVGWDRHSLRLVLRLRQVRLVLGLFAILTVGIVLIPLGDTLRQDGEILEWSNALVSKEIDAASTPRFLSQVIRDNPSPNVWVVSGTIAVPDDDYGETRGRYKAVVRQVCEPRRERKCWALEGLAFGGNGPPTSGRDVSATGASSRTNKVAIISKPSALEDTSLIETESNPTVEEAGEVYGGVTIVIDDDTDGSDDQKADDSNVENKAAGQIEVRVIKPENNVENLVLLIQDRLNRLGYTKATPLVLDGRFGPHTREVIAIYQRAHGMKIDGQASRQLLHHIESHQKIPLQN